MDATRNAEFGWQAEVHEFAAGNAAASAALSSLLNAVSDGACWVFPDGRLQPLNRRWFHLHGCEPGSDFPRDLGQYERRFAAQGSENLEFPVHPLRRASRGEAFSGLDYPLHIAGDERTPLLRWGSVAVPELQGRCLLIRAARTNAEQRAGLALLAGLTGINAALAVKPHVTELVQMVTDASTELSGAEYGAFFFVDTRTGRCHVYARSGPRVDAFPAEGSWQPEELFGVELPDHGVRRVQEPGALAGSARLPVRSCVAAAVTSCTGEALGGLLVGHSAPAAFDRSAEDAIAALAAQAAIAIDHSRARQALQRSEQHLVFALEAARMGTWEWHRHSGEVLCSEIMERIHGLAPGSSQHPFERFLRQLVPDDRAVVKSAMEQALEGRQPLRVEYRVVVQDRLAWVESKGRVLFDGNGEPVGMAGVASDISERKRSEERFRLAVEASPSAIVMLDGEGRITLANRQVTQLFGYAHDQLEGMTIDRLLPGTGTGRHPALAALDGDDFEQAARRVTELEGRDAQGRAIPLSVGANPIQVGNERYVLCALIDDSERKRAEENIRRVNEQLWRKNEEMEQFVYSVSHDLKSPLVTVTGFVGMLKEDLAQGDAQSAADSVERIERATRRMSALINDLLQLSRIGRVEIDRETVSLDEVVADLSHDLADRFRTHRAELKVQGPLPEISADRSRVVEVLDNLLSNALKYGCETPRAVITVGAERDDVEVRVFVRDQGPGIPQEYQAKIFQPFQRLDNRTQGTGVGLAIVEKIMRTHGGRAWVESESGHGSTFWLAFPERPT